MKKRIISILLTLAMVFSVVSTVSITASAATKGKPDSNTYCTVKISQKLLDKKCKQYATVKIKTYDASGWWNTGKKVRITLRDENGRYICSWIGKGGNTLKLGDDHKTYRIYVSRISNEFMYTGATNQWKISDAKNCSIS